MNIHKAPNINYIWSSLLIEELVRCGAGYFCIAPGSRSSPLAVAAARHPQARHLVHYDERGLAFHALGFSSARKKPAVLICTSGTAGANFYPAVIEASKKKVPLIVLTADRPPELRATGAVQTIDQVGLFGKYVKFQADLPCPDAAIKPQFVLTTVDQVVYQAMRNPSGVIHINCMFRDPLAPVATGENFKTYLRDLSQWMRSEGPYTTYIRSSASDLDAKEISRRIDGIKNGLIVVGKVGAAEQDAVVSLARHLGWPIFADVTSGLRLGRADKHVIAYFDQILASAKCSKKLPFDGILHLGGRMTSKRYYEFTAGLVLNDYVMVLNHPLRNDPGHQVSLRVESPIGVFCETLEAAVRKRTAGPLLECLTNANRAADAALEEYFAGHAPELSEPQTARLISQHIPKDSVLFLANSMPIRDVEFFADFKGHPVDVHGNRGASGIDGLVASASGVAVGSQRPVTLLIGDLALLHDLNSLAILRSGDRTLVIVVINNDGGGIFSFLPVAAEANDVFEKCFGTPHGLSFKEAAEMFGLSYAEPRTAGEFIRSFKQAHAGSRASLIEVKTSRGDNAAAHKAIQKIIVNAVERSMTKLS